MRQVILFHLLPLFLSAFIGCSKSNDAELERARAETEQLRKRLDALEGKSSGSTANPAESDAATLAQAVDAATPSRTPTAPMTGTLRVKIVRQSHLVPAGPPGPWLYVDRKLVHNYSSHSSVDNRGDIDAQLTLAPGRHVIEAFAAFTSPAGDQPPYFHVQSSEVLVEAGASQDVNLSIGLLSASAQRAYAALSYQTAERVLECANMFETRLALFAADTLALELDRLSARFRAQPPDKPVVMLGLPEKLGGTREVDADLVRVLVDYLNWQYWKNWPFYSSYPLPVDASDELRAAYQVMATLDARVRQKQEQIDNLKGIARELEAAGRSR